MTERQEIFCNEYVVDYNGTQAAMRAGYSDKGARQTAVKLLSNASVLARVRELQHEKVERLAVSADFVVLRLMDTLEKCMQAQPVMVWDPDQGRKVESGEYVFDSKGALRALELLGKHLGMFEDRLKVNGKLDTGQLDNVLAQLRGGGGG
nr:MAG TPA: Terminase small subunit [Caudoviricetes sp.]